MCMAKSPNKHNRLYGKAVPLEEGLSEDIEDGKVGPRDDPKARAKYLNDKYNWDKTEAGAKLWNFGPEQTGANCLVDATKGV